MKSWLAQHRVALVSAATRLWSSPLNTLLSLLVIGIALTLPAAGYLLIDNLSQLSGSASGVQQISLFLKMDAGAKEQADIESRLKTLNPGSWRFVPREEALKHLQASEGMADIVASLPRNPLPDAFIVDSNEKTPEGLENQRKTFAGWPAVAHVQLDSAWARRFDAFLRLGKLTVTLLAVVFGAGLIAITFNTIRLQVVSHAAEIEVARLIGATPAFIRRPFSYFGALQGALGGVLAALLVTLGFKLLNTPISQLAALYGSQFALSGPSAPEILFFILIGGVLGWLGAQLSVILSLGQFRS